MNISFGICIGPNYENAILQNLLTSIITQKWQNNDYEIIIVGNIRETNILPEKTHVVPFDENLRKGWITKKKNIIAKKAKFDILCVVHDYYLFCEDWYQNLIKYTTINPYWEILSNKITRKEGDRHSDWLVNQKYMDLLLDKYPHIGIKLMSVAPTENNGPRWVCGLPYDERELSHIQYISGGYILAKTDIYLNTPFDERYAWGEAPEDIIWSEAVIKKGHRFYFNPYSSMTLQKKGKWKLYEMPKECVLLLKEMNKNV